MSARILEGGHLNGYWSPRTSTLDWCEENYVVIHYIAEFWNTLSNLSFLMLSVVGLIRCWRLGLEKRFVISYLTLAVTGLGSWAFHATLLYEMQLLDEIPMLFCVGTLFYSCLEKGKTKRYGMIAPIALIAFILASCVAYVYLKFPAFHHTIYGTLSALVIVDTFMLSLLVDKRVARLLRNGSLTFIAAFCIWNVDNLCCDYLRGLRNLIMEVFSMIPVFGRPIGYLIASLFQLHAWWHILSGWGAYVVFLFLEYHRMTLGKVSYASNSQDVADDQDSYHSQLIVREDGTTVLVGISFWRGLIPYTWCCEHLESVKPAQAHVLRINYKSKTS